MSFYRRSVVKNPRKVRKCDLCGKEINGECLYEVGKIDGYIISIYCHAECLELADRMCSECPFSFDCQEDRQYCFSEEVGVKG